VHVAPAQRTADALRPLLAVGLALLYAAVATALGAALTERRDVEGR
jgi:hypothetical protein